ncbi:MAG: prepilin-type N-terminal cleavage/methylation domain-containing protein [Opitutales bacterium]|nr:prepilin-type N-terminal cleavage/methylation domain-containing protein [Opitutales bacterium]
MRNILFKNRRAFTLVEILVVIALLIVLASITFALAGPVKNSILTTKAKSQIQKISLALNEFKNKYGEYPMTDGGESDEDWAELLIDSVRGDRILVRRGGKLKMAKYNEGRSGAEPLPFLALGEYALDDDSDVENAKMILDPWENPYQYRYNKITGGKPGTQWDAPTFLLISAAADYEEPPSDDDYFCGDMERSGLFETDASQENYYYEDRRADNLVNIDMAQ